MYDKKLFTIATVATMLGISKATVYRLIHSDPTFPVIKIGNKFLIDASDLEKWVEHKKEFTLRGV